MFIRSRNSLAALIATVGMFAACEDSAKAPDPAPAAAKPSKPKIEGLPPDMVAAVSASRTASAIGMHFALGGKPEVNKALPVEIAIVPHQDFATVSAHFENQDGLAVSVGEDFGPMKSPALEKPLRHQLVLLPGREGVFVITASIETTDPSGNVTRVFSIPVVVSPTVSADAPGEPTTAQPQSPSTPATN
jgi:hypothetical protein